MKNSKVINLNNILVNLMIDIKDTYIELNLPYVKEDANFLDRITMISKELKDYQNQLNDPDDSNNLIDLYLDLINDLKKFLNIMELKL